MNTLSVDDFLYSPEDFDRLIKLLSNKKPQASIKVLGIKNLVENSLSELKRFKACESRIEQMKEALGRNYLSESEMLTALNNGEFPFDPAKRAEIKEYYSSFFKKKPNKNGSVKSDSIRSQPSGYPALRIKKALNINFLSFEDYESIKKEMGGFVGLKNKTDSEIRATCEFLSINRQ